MSSSPPEPASLRARVRATFLAPRTLSSLLSPAAPWLDVLLISTAVAMLAVLTIPGEVFLDPMDAAVSRRGEPVEITSAPSDIVWWGRGISMLGTLATHPMIAFVLAGFLTLVFSMIGGGRGNFRDFLSLASHSLLIPALGTLLVTGIRLAGDGFLPPLGGLTDEGAPLALFSAADPFVIWMLVVVGIGTSQLDGQRSAARASVVTVGIYLVFVIASSALLRG